MAFLLSVALGGCTKLKQNDPGEVSKERAEAKRQQDACASATAYDRLKGLLFDQAIAERDGDRSRLDTLADYSFVRMEAPVVKSWDPALDVTQCSGRLVLEVPARARQAFDGEQHLGADIEYSAQAAADGKGFVYQMKGAEPEVAQLAAFNLDSSAYRPPPAIDDAQGEPQPSGPDLAAQDDAATEPTDADPGPITREAGDGRSARQQAYAPENDPVRRAPERRSDDPVDAAAEAGEAIVRAFYAALGSGNGPAASAQVVPEKRGSRAYSPDAISRFYGKLAEPLRLLGIAPLSDDAYRVKYRYSAGRSNCQGSAVVTLADRDGRALIRSIRALSGC